MRVVLEGWRFLPHSYGVVDQFLCLELMGRAGVELFHRDVPYMLPTLASKPGQLGDQEMARRLAQIPTAPPDLTGDATVRLHVPLNLEPASAGRTLVFGTAEFGVIDPRVLRQATRLRAVNHREDLALMTPSEWSRSGLIRSGVDPDKVVALPLGFDPALFRPASPAQRLALRAGHGWQNDVVFLNLGALTANKGVLHLLRAFAAIVQEFPHARLVLKGLEQLYSSASNLREYCNALPPAQRACVEPRLTFLGKTLTYAETAALYQAADAYISPYLAEGFNLPVLEAAACGLPVVCTAGGPTDEFTDPSFALPVAGRWSAHHYDDVPGAHVLVPDETQLLQQMRRLVTDPALVARAREAGPAYLLSRYTWKHIADQLLALLGNPQARCWQRRPAGPIVSAQETNARASERHNQASSQYQQGHREAAMRLCLETLREEPLHANAIYLLGVLALDAGKAEEALLHFHHAATLRPDSANFQNALGEAYRGIGRHGEAIVHFHEALALDPALASAHNGLGQVLLDRGAAAEAEASFRAALAVNPRFERAHLNLGRCLIMRGDLAGAEAAFVETLRLKPDYATAHNNLAAVLLAQAQPLRAEKHCRQALQFQPVYPEAHFNLGAALAALGDPAAARPHFAEAIRLRPNYPRALHGLGRALEALGELRQASDCYRESLRLAPDFTQGLESLGNLLMLQSDWEGARAALERLLALDPANALAFSRLFFIKQALCDWAGREDDLRRLWRDVQVVLESGKAAPIRPFDSLCAGWTGAQQLAVARSHADAVAADVAAQRKLLALPPRPAGASSRDKLRVGYLSGEFRDHPVGHLMQSILEKHDRQAFEVFAYSFGPEDGSSCRQRIMRGCDHFRELRNVALVESVRRIHADGLHLLIDLQGHADFSRMNVLAFRPAPIQVNYLGYPGTTGADFIDYLISDPIVTPVSAATDFRETLVLLPNCYLAAEYEQPVARPAGRRADHGLPEDATVFCAFGSSYRIEPTIHDVWMRILTGVPGSFLWLSSASALIQKNLRREAEARGVSGSRLVFAPRTPAKADHLGRHQWADLFLDTWTYSGRTTTCDALWAGLPVLTCPGESFASRVSASLVTNAGLPEMVVASLRDYERRAIELGRDRKGLGEIASKLRGLRSRCPLFGTSGFVRDLERAFRAMVERSPVRSAPVVIPPREEHPSESSRN
jgi:predicted O-linked N-acetylglucosamine transferase (SPINDLY family)